MARAQGTVTKYAYRNQPDFREQFRSLIARQNRGEALSAKEEALLATEEVEVLEVDTVSGPRLVSADHLEALEQRDEAAESDEDKILASKADSDAAEAEAERAWKKVLKEG